MSDDTTERCAGFTPEFGQEVFETLRKLPAEQCRLADVRTEQDRMLAVLEVKGPRKLEFELRTNPCTTGASVARLEASDDARTLCPEAARALERIAARPARPLLGATRAVSVTPPTEHVRRPEAVPLYSDGILLLLGALALAIVFALRLARPLSRRGAWLLVAVLVAGAVFRAVLAPATILNAWPYARLVPWAELVYYGPVVRFLGVNAPLTQVISWTSLALASLTPLAFFAHARALHRSENAGLASALLIATLPMHVRFSAGDDSFVQLVFTASLAFGALHVALADRNRAIVGLALVALPVLAFAAFRSRPLAVALTPVLVATALAFRPGEIPRPRRTAATLLVLVAAAADLRTHLTREYASQMSEGLSLKTFVDGALSIVDPRYDTLLVPWLTPPGFLLLAVFGAVAAWKSERRRALLLLGWLLVYFLLLGYVLAPIRLMQARYHLHLAEPFVSLAAVGLARLFELRFAFGGGAAAYALASPFVHFGVVRDADFSPQHEFAFLERLRSMIPTGCTVLEYTGRSRGPEDSARTASRLDRIAARLAGGTPGRAFETVNLGTPAKEHDSVNDAARGLLASPPACVFYYQGLSCFSEKRFEEPLAPACARVHELSELVRVTTTQIPNRIYDENMGLGLGARTLELDGDGRFERPMRTEIPLELFRVVPSTEDRSQHSGPQPASFPRPGDRSGE